MKLTAWEQFPISARKAWMIMRLSSVFILIFALHLSARTAAQRVTMSSDGITIGQLLHQLQKQTPYSFLLEEGLVSPGQKISVHVKNVPLESVLEQVLKPLGLSYRIDNKAVYIVKDPAIVSIPKNTEIPPVDVHGRVTDSLGNPLAGASVTVKGTKMLIATDANGEFKLTGVNPNATIVISYIGYEKREYKLKGETDLNFSLKVLTNDLSKVDVTFNNGYQFIPKDRATGSFSEVDSALFNRTVSTNVLDRLNGVVSGLNMSPLSTPPGNITIWGISTINANKSPLVVVDGFPYDGDFNDLNPNDVESITVLKDAAAASIWGAQAGNGVIVIVTKKGRFNQKPSINLNSNVTLTKKPDLYYLPTISSADEITAEKYFFNQGLYPDYSSFGYFNPAYSKVVELQLAQSLGQLTPEDVNNQLAQLSAQDVRNDVNKYLNQTGVNQQYALSISGGTSNFNYYGSVGYDNTRSTSVGNEYNRLSINFSNTYRPLKNLEMTSFINYVQSNTDNNALTVPLMPPYTQLADSKGDALTIPKDLRLPFVDTARYPGLLDWHYRPLDELKYADNNNKQFDTRFGISLKYTFIPGLSVEAKYQYQKILTNGQNYSSDSTYYARNLINQYMYVDPNSGNIIYPVPVGGILQLSNSAQTSWNFRGQLNYNHTWSDHELVALAGVETREVSANGNGSMLYGFSPSSATYNTQLDFSTSYNLNPLPGGGYSEVPNSAPYYGSLYRYLSYFANEAYTFKRKYTITGSVRFDGANLYGAKTNQKIAPLWSVGGGWEISKEEFYHSSWLPFLKLRATYGYNGNTNNGNAFSVIQLSGPGPFSVIPATFGTVLNPPNPDLRWEKIGIAKLGLDFATKNHVINGTLEYYQKNGKDLIGPILLDYTSGWTSITGNNAGMKSSGFDISLDTRNLNGRLKWVTNFIFSSNTQKVVSYETAAKTPVDYFNGGVVLDKPINGIFSYKWGGLDPATGDPRGYDSGKVVDYTTLITNGKTSDLVYSGPSTPTIFGALRNTFTWQSISLSFNIIYKFGYYFRRSSINYSELFGTSTGNSDFALRWQKPGDELKTNVPSLPASLDANRDYMYTHSDILVEKGDNIRLQDVRISYEFEPSLLRHLSMQSASVFVYANNLGIIWRANHSGIDPDYGDRSIPVSRSISVGLNVQF